MEAFRGRLESSDQAFDRALEQISPHDAGALISAWLRRGRWLRGGICHPRESRRSYQNALDVLDRDPASDLPARAEALAGLAWAEAVAGDPAEVDELLAEADRILGGDRPGDLLAHDIGVARGHALIRAGRFTDSFGPLIAASAAAGRAGRPDMSYSCLSNAASAAACAGEFGRALDFADRCLPLVTPNGLLRLSVYAQTARSAILRRLGRLAEARQACDAAAGFSDRAGLPELDGLVGQERGPARPGRRGSGCRRGLAGRRPGPARAGEQSRYPPSAGRSPRPIRAVGTGGGGAAKGRTRASDSERLPRRPGPADEPGAGPHRVRPRGRRAGREAADGVGGRMAADRGDAGQRSDRRRLRGRAHRSRPPARKLAGGARA